MVRAVALSRHGDKSRPHGTAAFSGIPRIEKNFERTVVSATILRKTGPGYRRRGSHSQGVTAVLASLGERAETLALDYGI